MKRLTKKKKNHDTIEAYCKCANCGACGCFCYCGCICPTPARIVETAESTYDSVQYSIGYPNHRGTLGAIVTGV